MVVGRRPEPLGELCKEIADVSGGNAQAFVFALDVSAPELMAKAVEDFVSDVGGVDVLVANAGINPQRANATQATDAAWHETFEVNVTGVHFSCQAVLPHMEKVGKGAIVTVGSIAGLTGMKNRAAYGPSKAAVINYTQALAIDYGPAGIRANCVCPGFVITDINRDWLEALPAEQRRDLEKRHALGMGSPEAVADAIYFLASDKARWITGVALPVDGGWLAS
jgi:NAD(P)-dependent dehydrogenase (short-subunit alcohol dehydrogenase family)